MSDGKADGMSEKAVGWALILAVLAVFLWVIYHFILEDEINNAIRWIRYWEMWAVSWFVSDDYMVTLLNGKTVNLQEWMEATKNYPVEKLDFGILAGMTSLALLPMKWFFAGIIILIGLWTYTRGPGTQFTDIFNLDGFLNFQSKAFPVIAPFHNFNPAKMKPRAPGSPVPVELPLFAEALGPEEWLAYNQIPVPDGVINEEACLEAFSEQLGRRWAGPKALRNYEKILLAACCYKAARERVKSDDLMSKLALCWDHEKGFQMSKNPEILKEANRVLKNKELAGPVLKKCNQHAWTTTALLRALLTAREEGGVMAPAQFVWLRGHDRLLWYPLNNLGRQSHHMEAVGAMAHFKEEKRAQRPIPRAKVKDAVTAIVEYMADSNARPIPTLDYSASTKRGIKKVKTA